MSLPLEHTDAGVSSGSSFLSSVSATWQVVADGDPGAKWEACLPPASLFPMERSMQLSSTLAQLAHVTLQARRVFNILWEPLYEPLTCCDIDDLRTFAEYLQLPKDLVLRLQQQEAVLELQRLVPPLRDVDSARCAIDARPVLRQVLDAAWAAHAPSELPHDGEELEWTDPALLLRSNKFALAGALGLPMPADAIGADSEAAWAGYAQGCTLAGRVSMIAGGDDSVRGLGMAGAPCVLVAAAVGDLDSLQALCAAGAPLTRCAILAAARYGHVDVLNWTDAQAKVARSSLTELNEHSTARHVLAAGARGGHLHVCHWTLACNPGFSLLERPDEGASSRGDDADNAEVNVGSCGGSVQVLDLLEACGFVPTMSNALAACEAGHLAILQHVAATGVLGVAPAASLEECAATAAGHGRVEVLQWLHEAGLCDPAARRIHHSAFASTWPVLRWAREKGYVNEWNAGMCAGLARRGDVGGLQALRAAGCPWDEATPLQAARSSHEALFRWAVENGCPWNPDGCLRMALQRPLALQQYREFGYAEEDARAAAARDGATGIAAWIRQRCGFADDFCGSVGHSMYVM